MCHADIRAPVSPEVWLTDAYLGRGAVCVASLQTKTGDALWRVGDLRGRHTWLEPARVVADGARLHPLSPVEVAFADVVRASCFRPVANYPFRGGEHITLK